MNLKARQDMTNLNKMKRNYLAITANKIDLFDNSNYVTSFPESYRRSSFDTTQKNKKRLGGRW